MLLNEDNLTKDLLEDSEKLITYVENKYNGWLAQVKNNGVRAVISVKDKKITAIRDRRDTPILQNYPELKDVEIPVSEGLFDAEIVMLGKNGKSFYYNEYDEKKNLTQAGIQLRSMSLKDTETIKNHPVNIVLFDVLKLNGETLISKPYSYRHQKLESVPVSDTDRVTVAKNYTFRELWKMVKDNDLEGAVVKNPNGFYEIDTRSNNNIKVKNYKLIDVEVESTEKNNKGVKIFGKTAEGIKVNFQLFGVDDLNKGTIMKIKYLEKIGGVGGRYSQTTVA